MSNVQIYRTGDQIRHRITGYVYTVSHVIIAGFYLKIQTLDGLVFDEEEIEKITYE